MSIVPVIATTVQSIALIVILYVLVKYQRLILHFQKIMSSDVWLLRSLIEKVKEGGISDTPAGGKSS